MPLKLNVGASKKIGEPNFGSRGASINLEPELDGTLVGEPAKLQARIRELFTLARQALDQELNGGNDPKPPDNNGAPASVGSASQPSNGYGHASGGTRPATPAQIKALYGITRHQGLDLGAVLRERCHVGRPEELTLRQASALIGQLKSTVDSPAT